MHVIIDTYHNLLVYIDNFSYFSARDSAGAENLGGQGGLEPPHF